MTSRIRSGVSRVAQPRTRSNQVAPPVFEDAVKVLANEKFDRQHKKKMDSFIRSLIRPYGDDDFVASPDSIGVVRESQERYIANDPNQRDGVGLLPNAYTGGSSTDYGDEEYLPYLLDFSSSPPESPRNERNREASDSENHNAASKLAAETFSRDNEPKMPLFGEEFDE